MPAWSIFGVLMPSLSVQERVLRVIAPVTIFITRFIVTARIPGFAPRLQSDILAKTIGSALCRIAFEVT